MVILSSGVRPLYVHVYISLEMKLVSPPFPPEGVTETSGHRFEYNLHFIGTSGHHFEYNLHFIKISSHLDHEGILDAGPTWTMVAETPRDD